MKVIYEAVLPMSEKIEKQNIALEKKNLYLQEKVSKKPDLVVLGGMDSYDGHSNAIEPRRGTATRR